MRPHEHGGNPGYPADPMLRALVMQYALNERYANGFLNRLGSDDRLLRICGLECRAQRGSVQPVQEETSPLTRTDCGSRSPRSSWNAETRSNACVKQAWFRRTSRRWGIRWLWTAPTLSHGRGGWQE